MIPPDLASDLLPLQRELTARLGSNLRAAWVFGSFVTPGVRRPDSIPDLVALVDDRARAVGALARGPLVRWLCAPLPPAILRLSVGERAAKLNLFTPADAAEALDAPRDLYLVGRLSKASRLLYARDASCAAQHDALRAAAEQVMAGLALQDLPPRCLLDDAVRACLRLSYRAEVRPERPARLEAAFADHAAEYRARYAPALLGHAARRGLIVEGEALVDPRPEDARQVEAAALAALLRRSRRRFLLRMLRQGLVYRGAVGYLIGKLRRARSQPQTSS